MFYHEFLNDLPKNTLLKCIIYIFKIKCLKISIKKFITRSFLFKKHHHPQPPKKNHAIYKVSPYTKYRHIQSIAIFTHWKFKAQIFTRPEFKSPMLMCWEFKPPYSCTKNTYPQYSCAENTKGPIFTYWELKAPIFMCWEFRPPYSLAENSKAPAAGL